MAVILTAVATGCGGSSSGGGPQTYPPTWFTHKSELQVPVTACPTTRATDTRPAEKYGKNLAATVTTRLADKLGYYSDDVRNLKPVLGPRGWTCEVEVGADGSTTMTIHPAGTASSSTTAVTVQWISACQGCMYNLVCSLIPDSSKQVGASFGACPTTRPKGESVDVRSDGSGSYIAEFVDPPGLRGVGLPSGGPFQASGILNYDWSRHRDAAALETCALPGADQLGNSDLECRAIELFFANHHWGMPEGMSGVAIG